MKTIELIGPALDWAVAQCEGVEVEYINDGITRCLLRLSPFTCRYSPSTEWAQGGPIIEREGTAVIPDGQGEWTAELRGGDCDDIAHAPTPLIAAMRCFVALRLGDEIEIPEELK